MLPRDNRRWTDRLEQFARWLGRLELKILLLGLLVVLGVWAFIAIAVEVEEGDTKYFDMWVMQSLRRHGNPSLPVGPWWLPELARDITSLGSYAVLILLVAAVVVFLVLQRRYATMWLVIASTGSGIAISDILKAGFGRPRPHVSHLTEVFTSSFPSGHAMVSTIVYLTLATLLARIEPQRKIKAYILGVAIFVCFLIGLSRVYLGVHYPTDVLAGWSAGLVWAILCLAAARYLQQKGMVAGSGGDEHEPH